MDAELEICCYSTADAVLALSSGADRVELCAGEPEGGTTPSLGFLEEALAACPGSVFPMVRPRGGPFVYDDFEIAAMSRDVHTVATLGFPGVVFGALDASGRLDEPTLSRLIDQARSVNPEIALTFHRAFDVTADPVQAFDLLTDLGFDRVLTSGQQPTAYAGLDLLAELAARGGATIMAGGGVRPANAVAFLDVGVRSLHSSASHEPGGGVDPRVVQTLRTLTLTSTS